MSGAAAAVWLAGWSAVAKGSVGGPANGALINATEPNTSGRTSAHQAATEAPKSWPTTAALVGGDRIKPGRGQDRHDLAPGIGEFGEAVQQQHARPIGGPRSGLEHMHPEPVDIVDMAGADARRQHVIGKRRQ